MKVNVWQICSFQKFADTFIKNISTNPFQCKQDIHDMTLKEFQKVVNIRKRVSIFMFRKKQINKTEGEDRTLGKDKENSSLSHKM